MSPTLRRTPFMSLSTKRATAVAFAYLYLSQLLQSCGFGGVAGPQADIHHGPRLASMARVAPTVPTNTIVPTDKMSNGLAADTTPGGGTVSFNGSANYSV